MATEKGGGGELQEGQEPGSWLRGNHGDGVLGPAWRGKYYRLGRLNNQHLVSTALEAGTKALADSESGERLPRGK